MKDAWTRRECLKLGVTASLGTALFRLPGMPQGVAGEAAATRPAKGIALRHLESGLAALANTWRGYWGNGHYGAAAIAAYFFAREQELDERTCKAIEGELDAFRAAGAEFFDFATPATAATPERLPEIVASLEKGIDSSRGAGHDVIFASLALKAFRHAPALAKPEWIDGILALDDHLRGHFRPDADTDFNRANPLPNWQTPQELRETALACFVRRSGIGEVGLIHCLTHADAVAELWEMGHEPLAVRGSAALKIHLNLDPAPTPPETGLAKPWPESPLTHALWENPAVRNKTWGFRGHTFKFPCSYYHHRAALRDAELRQQCDERALSVLGSVVG